MKRSVYAALAVLFIAGLATAAYAIDRVGSQQKSETTDSPAPQGSGASSQKEPKKGSGSGTGSASTKQSTPSKMDTGAPGTPGGSGLGTDTGTEKTKSGK